MRSSRLSGTLLRAIILAAVTLSFGRVSAQADGPIYIVQPNDTLSSIAANFNVSMEALMAANGISDPNLIAVGQELVIPGLEGITGVLDTAYINFGDSYWSLLRRTQVPEQLLRTLNRLVSPTEFYVGASVIVPTEGAQPAPRARMTVASGESLLELAVKNGSDVWTLKVINQLAGTWSALPGDVLYLPAGNLEDSSSGLPSAFESAQFRNLPIEQGATAVIKIKTQAGVQLGGILIDHELRFFPNEDGTQVALQGVHALLEPGVYPVRLDADLPGGARQSFEQMVLIASRHFGDITIPVPSETLNPDVTDPENRQVFSTVAPATPIRRWRGEFSLPVALPSCIKDWFGIRRTYVGQGTDTRVSGFHSGVDYGICSETHPYDIFAAADGTVVFAGPLTVRGNATIIDHGWGVYSGYWHQEELYVGQGDAVQTGQLIGKMGATGRVTGPHLHWEIFVNSVQVEPLDWLEESFP